MNLPRPYTVLGVPVVPLFSVAAQLVAAARGAEFAAFNAEQEHRAAIADRAKTRPLEDKRAKAILRRLNAKPDASFTTVEIYEKLRRAGMVCPRHAVHQALFIMIENGEIQRTRSGKEWLWQSINGEAAHG